MTNKRDKDGGEGREPQPVAAGPAIEPPKTQAPLLGLGGDGCLGSRAPAFLPLPSFTAQGQEKTQLPYKCNSEGQGPPGRESLGRHRLLRIRAALRCETHPFGST